MALKLFYKEYIIPGIKPLPIQPIPDNDIHYQVLRNCTII